MLTAAKWQDWLHPRGKDGRFIEKGAFVNVFASPTALLNDKTADRRRGQITELRPEGAFVRYQDLHGNPLPPDPENGYPNQIPVDELSTKVSTAPQAIAHLQPGESAAKEVTDALVPAMSQADYDDEITSLNQALTQMHAAEAQVVSTGQEAISDADFQAHEGYVSKINQVANGHGLTLDKAFKDSFGLWSEEWQQIFDSVVDEAYDDLTANQTKPKDRRAIMLGGLPGAGKSSTLKAMTKAGVFKGDDWITVNPDHFKDVMMEKGLAPQIHGLAPAETANFIHMASSEMSHMLEQLLTVEGYNVIFDITMGGRPQAGEKPNHEQILDRLESLDYGTDGIFVDVPPTTARTRTRERHKSGLDKLRTGLADRPGDPETKFGGRVVPEALILAAQLPPDDPDGETYNSLNARNFDQLKKQFVRWAAWDNSGDAPEFVDGSGIGTDDPLSMPGYYPPAASPGSDAAPSPVGASA